MMAVAIEHKGWMGVFVNVYEGETPGEIVEKIMDFQNMDCLVRMGYSEEPESKYNELKKIEEFIDLYENNKEDMTLEDIVNFSFNLSCGSFKSVGKAENDEAVEKLKEKYSK